MDKRKKTYRALVKYWSFALRVGQGFMHNQGMLLAGAVAFYTLLSIVPLSIIALIVLTHFIEDRQLLVTLSTYLEMVIPGYAATLTEQVREFIGQRRVVGVIGFLGMLFFSSTAFSMFENAMAVIFSSKNGSNRRSFLASAIIPYLYIIAMGIGLLLVTGVIGVIETLVGRSGTLFDWSLNPGVATWVGVYCMGILGEVVMFTSLYLVMPETRVKTRHALIGGITVTVLWEITRRVLIWYYSVVTMVNVIYGSISITVVALIFIEVVAVILLLGAQVIAELERGVPESDSSELAAH
jgi:YihY family inner membrane protein